MFLSYRDSKRGSPASILYSLIAFMSCFAVYRYYSAYTSFMKRVGPKSRHHKISGKYSVMSPNFQDRLCPPIPPSIVGLRNASLDDVLLEEVERQLVGTPGLETGGTFRPVECQSRYKVAIVVPYRDRPKHLPIFLRHMHPFLQRQQLAYTIFIVEQTHSAQLNRGALKNIGYMEALKQEFFECFFFHDIDYLPEDDRNLYHCPATPQHLAILQTDTNYTSMGWEFFGGVVGFPTGDFARVNGYSNSFWGWGGEDNNLLDRVDFHDLPIFYLKPEEFARYTLQSHVKDKASPFRHQVLNRSLELSKYDGLTNLKYRLMDLKFKPLYTHILVDLVEAVKS